MIAFRHLLALLPFPIVILIISPVFGGPAFAAQSTVAGYWATEGYSSVVEIKPCLNETTRICGTIVWLWDAVDATGAPVTDAENPNPEIRTRPLIGREILTGHVPAGLATAGQAKGQIYNPGDGRTYRATIRLITSDTLHVEGCVMIICRTQVWRRPDSLPRFDVTAVSGRS